MAATTGNASNAPIIPSSAVPTVTAISTASDEIWSVLTNARGVIDLLVGQLLEQDNNGGQERDGQRQQHRRNCDDRRPD